MKNRSIGLSELINQVKKELLEKSDSLDQIPLLSVEDVELEISVTVSKEGEGGINIQVVELGAGITHTQVHTVRVRLSPLLSKEERLADLKTDSRWEKIVSQQKESLLKGLEKEISNPDEFSIS
jgi:hypothetical protein